MGARFVRVGITGFKSFADPTSIEILPGLTGVVGPNGCGKSNVAEALRWAMGEANVRSLRGGEMDDVIFAGTANRPSRNLAEVSLHLESDEHGLPAPFSGRAEVQIARRIERGCGSAYRVDGREARARDVQTLFADLASGARSSAMVSQGRVGALVNAKPEERRAVLEEAAGITGLHARRAEAETRLRAAEANLEKAEERLAMLEQQLAALRGQSRQAARYRTVMEGALEAEAALLAIALSLAQAARIEADTTWQGTTDAVADAGELAQAAAVRAQHAQSALPALRDGEAAAQTRLERARVTQESVASEAARAESALAASVQRGTQIARDLAHAEALLADAEGAEARLLAEAARLRAECDNFPAELDSVQAEAKVAAEALLEADQMASEAGSAAADATALARVSKQMLDGAEARARRAQDASNRLDAERIRAAAQIIAPEELDAAAAAWRAADTTLANARQDQEQAEAGRSRTAAAASQAREAQGRLDAIRHKLAAETGALVDVLQVKDGERWRPMVDRLVVPAGLEAALGASLGEELAAADDPGAARHWRSLPPLPRVPGGAERLADLVSAPQLLARALGEIGLVASDAEGDAQHASLQPGQCLVSAAGAVWRWDGYTVRAGAPTAAAVRLRQRNRLSVLRLQLAEAERDATGRLAARNQAELAEREALGIEQAARLTRRGAETEFERAQTAAQGLRAQAEAAASRLATLLEQIQQLAPELEEASAAFQAAQRSHDAQLDPAVLRARSDQARAALASARARDSTAARALHDLRQAEAARQARLASIDREREDRRMRATDLAARVVDLRARADHASAEHVRLNAAPAQAAEHAKEARTVLAEAMEAQQSALAARQAAEREVVVATAAERSAEHAVFAAREALVRAEGAKVAAAQLWSAATTRVAEREGALPPLPSVTDPSPAAEDRARNRLQRLQRERDDMGPVNLRADIESQAIEADRAGIVRDRDELATAIAKLRGSIGNLNREGRERLAAVFQQVDRHFQALFARMFGGGRAHLALVGSDDPLQAGLEIYAQPPGKKLASLGLLSGGEQALTALSLIFAVFRCNPAPLCVLDEVDAPLDDANVERFCALLSDMVQETGTRFLVVTHHQVTMSRMDRLYGVTMQERGVSRLLSVDLSRAVGMIEAVAAE